MSRTCCFVTGLSVLAFGLQTADAAPERPTIVLETPAHIQGPQVSEAQGLRLVYVNFDGVTLTGSNQTESASQNLSAIPVLGGVIGPGQTLTIPAFQPNQLGDNGNGLSRDQIITRAINQLYASHAPYNVEFVTERPAAGTTYSMVVIGGSCQSVAGQNGCGGIALLDCGDMLPGNITFMFPPGLRVDDIASVTAQEAAHAFGLSHTDDRDDVMFPQIQQSIPTIFGAGNVPDTPNCGASFQDSDGMMLSTIGPRGQDTIPPAVEITSPADGAVVAAGATVTATATDNVMVSSIETLVDGVSLGTQGAGPVSFQLPATATAGAVQIRVEATDSSGNVGAATITVNISEDGGEGNLGDSCVDGTDCDSRVCGELDGDRRCTRTCNAQSPCPAGFECLNDVACWPTSSGGCQASSGGASGFAVLALIAFFAIARRRRQ